MSTGTNNDGHTDSLAPMPLQDELVIMLKGYGVDLRTIARDVGVPVKEVCRILDRNTGRPTIQPDAMARKIAAQTVARLLAISARLLTRPAKQPDGDLAIDTNIAIYSNSYNQYSDIIAIEPIQPIEQQDNCKQAIAINQPIAENSHSVNQSIAKSIGKIAKDTFAPPAPSTADRVAGLARCAQAIRSAWLPAQSSGQSAKQPTKQAVYPSNKSPNVPIICTSSDAVEG